MCSKPSLRPRMLLASNRRSYCFLTSHSQLLVTLIADTFIDELQRECAQRRVVGSVPIAGLLDSPRSIAPLLFGSVSSSTEGLKSDGFCASPLSVMTTLATGAPYLQPLHPILNRGWYLQEDVPGKPGWITYGSGERRGSGKREELSFSLRFQTGGLTVGFLRSYKNLGRAQLWIEGGDGGPTRRSPAILQGLWEERTSQLAKIHLSGISAGRHEVHITPLCGDSDGSGEKSSCKFKLLLLMSC
jgi:hypothetical protein